MEARHVVYVGTGDVNGAVGTLREGVGPFKILGLRDALGFTAGLETIYSALVNVAEVKVVLFVHPDAIERESFGD